MPDYIDDPKVARSGGILPGIEPDGIDDPKIARSGGILPGKYQTWVLLKRPSQQAPDVRAISPQQRGTGSRGTNEFDDPKIARSAGILPRIEPDGIDDPKLARKAKVRPKYEPTVRAKPPSQLAPDVPATKPPQRGTEVRGPNESRPTPVDRGLANANPQLPGRKSTNFGNEEDKTLSAELKWIKEQASTYKGENISPFGFGDVILWSEFGRDYILLYKDLFVHRMRETIKAAAQAYHLPPELLAGVAHIEVGGADPLKPIVYRFRRDIDDDPVLRRSGASYKYEYSDKTSLGPLAIQVRRAAESLGYDPKRLSYSQRQAIIGSLNNPAEAIYIAAKHLSDLRKVDFAGLSAPKDLTEAEIEIIGARYNQGPDRPLSKVVNDLSYGKTIYRKWEHLSRLLADDGQK